VVIPKHKSLLEIIIIAITILKKLSNGIRKPTENGNIEAQKITGWCLFLG